MKTHATKSSPNQRAATSSSEQPQSDPNISMQSQLHEQQIASRACKIWQEQGCPEGHEAVHLKLARQEILDRFSK